MFQLPFFLERSLRHSSSSFRLFSTSSFNEDTVVSLPFTTSTKFLGDKINCLPHEIKSTSKIFYCSKQILREPLENTQCTGMFYTWCTGIRCPMGPRYWTPTLAQGVHLRDISLRRMRHFEHRKTIFCHTNR